MISKLCFLLLFLLLIFPFASSWVFGDYLPIQNVSDPGVQDLGSNAVSEYNKNGEGHLTYIEVINGTLYYSSLYKGYATTMWSWLRAKNGSHCGPAEIYDVLVTRSFEYIKTANPDGQGYREVVRISYTLGYFRLLSTVF